MKFLCGNCKAKYQIADEKVTGRTLRMKCRRCGHDILIDGHGASPSSPPSAPPQAPRRGTSVSVVPPAPARSSAVHAPAGAATLPRPAGFTSRAEEPRTSPVSRSKPPSGLSADFRRHVAAPPEVPQRTAPYDLWHVAIQDVPVGPMSRDELSRKIEAGAVVPESLCWREGMDDWRPLGELPELAGLLRRSRELSRPAAPRVPRPPAAGPSATAAAAPRVMPPPPPQAEEDDEGAEPTRISEFLPSVQGQLAPPVPASGSVAKPLPVEPAPVPFAAAQQRTGSGLNGLGLVAVGLLGGILLVGGPMLYRQTWGSSPEPEKPAPAAVAPVQPAPAPPRDEPPVVAITPDEDEPEAKDEEDRPAPDRKGPARASKVDPGKGKALSDEQRRLLERMGGGGNDPDLRGMNATRGEQGGGGPVPAALTPAQLTKVVQDNKTQLQRCYETALRAAGGKQEGAVKVTVSVVVGTSGGTKSVSTQGDGLGNMTDCIRSSVKRWRFPQAQGDSEFTFPLVFQPGS